MGGVVRPVCRGSVNVATPACCQALTQVIVEVVISQSVSKTLRDGIALRFLVGHVGVMFDVAHRGGRAIISTTSGTCPYLFKYHGSFGHATELCVHFTRVYVTKVQRVGFVVGATRRRHSTVNSHILRRAGRFFVREMLSSVVIVMRAHLNSPASVRH